MSLWFVVPAHGRLELSAICLRQLRRTCDALTDHGIEATAVVVADDENLDTAWELGFATYERDNQFTSRKFNDGIQLAMDKRYNPHPADWVVPCGSDDWVDWQLFTDLPRPDTMVAFQNMSFVSEDGRELTSRFIGNRGGCGIRIYTRHVMERLGFRPADEDRRRGCDTSMLINLNKAWPLRIEHRASDPLQIVDWKTAGGNLNPYDHVVARHRGQPAVYPFEVLADRFPVEALDEMSAHYGVAVAA